VLESDETPAGVILVRVSLFLLSSATLLFEINLTRVFSVAQFYHFAFMIVSLALLGFGASGTALSIFPKLTYLPSLFILAWTGIGTAVSMLLSYMLINWIAFDSFSIAWDFRQVFILVLHYTALATPFFFSGLAVGALLSGKPSQAGTTYAVNLIGSAAGCILALIVPSFLGGEGVVSFSIAMVVISALIASPGLFHKRVGILGTGLFFCLACPVLLLNLSDIIHRISDGTGLPAMEIRISPYKGITYALQYPGAKIVNTRWNAFSRVDLIQSNGIRSLPGLSYRYTGMLPAQNGLLIDADDLNPVVLPQTGDEFVDFMPGSLVYKLRPEADALILEGRGGLDILIGLSQGANEITAVEPNALVIENAAQIYNHPKIRVFQEIGRSYTRRSDKSFDVVVLSLTNGYHPVSSGAYSLAEDYRYTVESFRDALAVLKPDGMLLVQRWLQLPPSEWLRSFALAVTALEESGLDPRQNIVAYRSYNLGTLIIKKEPFTGDELDQVRQFTSSRAYDMVYAPDISTEELNRFNILPEPVYYQAFIGLLSARSRADWYADYDYDVSPPRDSHPFFGHFFKWSQARRILAEIGKNWQPFGGAGYFILILLLVMTVGIATIIILLPLVVIKRRGRSGVPRRVWLDSLLYFGLIGMAFMMVEIPMIQRFILYLGYPAYSFTAVLFAILFFSGIGSYYSRKYSGGWSLALLAAMALSMNFLIPVLFQHTLGLSLPWRLALTMLLIAPLGFFMGVPFPGGLTYLEKSVPQLIPWVWGVNGAASVISSVLAALIALSFGFNWVLTIGAGCYLAALWTIGRLKNL